MRMVKCIRGEGMFANPTGVVEFSECWGCVPIVVAAKVPSDDSLGLFLNLFPRVVSVPKYRIVRMDASDIHLQARVRLPKLMMTGWTA